MKGSFFELATTVPHRVSIQISFFSGKLPATDRTLSEFIQNDKVSSDYLEEGMVLNLLLNRVVRSLLSGGLARPFLHYQVKKLA